MKSVYVIGVEILTSERRLLDYGILEAKANSLKLVTTRFMGTAIGGAILVLFSSIYWFLIGVPFVFLHLAPITLWNPAAGVLFATTVPLGFFALLFFSMGLVRRIQIKYSKTSRNIVVSNVQIARFRHTMEVRGDTGNLFLMASCKRSKFEDAMALSGQL